MKRSSSSSSITTTTTLFAMTAFMAITAVTSGCALTGKGDALTIRYFSPEAVKPELTSATSSGGASNANANANATTTLSLELGRVSSGSHLHDKIAYRDSAFELGYYDDRRWTERPEVYVRRELARTLFEEHGIRRSLAAQALVLDVEVISFEELRGKTDSARIQLRVLVHDDRDAFLEKTITVDRPLTGPKDIDALVQAMSLALDTATEEVAKATETVLRSHATTATSAAPNHDAP